MDVLEADDQGSLRRGSFEQLPHGPEGLLCRRGLLRQADKASHAPRNELGLLARTHQLRDAFVRVVPSELPNDLDQRVVGDRLPVREATAYGDGGC